MKQFQQLYVLLVAFAAAVAHLTESAVLFSALSPYSTGAPDPMESLPGCTHRQCSFLCQDRPICLGFYWLQGLCQLFNTSAFHAKQLWISSVQSDIYTYSGAWKLPIVGCSQISTRSFLSCPGSYCGCNLATDGSRSQVFDSGSCTHTQFTDGPWWEAELPTAAFISFVTLYNRDNNGPRLNRFALQVDGVECNRVNLTVQFSVASFPCVARGSRVRIASFLTGDALTICEFEAYGQP